MEENRAYLTDETLLQLSREGDEIAFTILFRRHFDGLLQFAEKQLQNREEAEELVMDLMLKLWEGKSFYGVKQLDQYLYRSVKNAIISRWRKKALSLIPLEEMHVNREPIVQAADHFLIESELQLFYQNKLSGLSPQRRMVFSLSRQYDMTAVEIAQETNLSVNTIKNHLKASLQYFREQLKGITILLLIIFILF